MPICQFCQRRFATISARNQHQRTAEYCLKGRATPKPRFKCNYCDETFGRKGSQIRHTQKCTLRINIIYQENERLTNELEEFKRRNQKLEEQNHELISQIQELAVLGMKKTTTTHNTTNNTTNIQFNAPFNLTQAEIKEKMSGLTSTHLVNGVEAVVGWIRDELLVDTDRNLLYRCTNPKDGTFRYMDESGSVQKDCRGRKLISLIQQPFNDRGAEVCAELVDEVDRTNVDDREALETAVERMRMGHSTYCKLRKMNKSSCFVRELGVITYG